MAKKRKKKRDENQKEEEQITIQTKIPEFNLDTWEVDGYRFAIELARELAVKLLENIDRELFEERPENWVSEGLEERKVITKRFGELTISRHAYRDEKGRRHFLLDEHLKIPPYEESASSPDEASDILLKELDKFKN